MSVGSGICFNERDPRGGRRIKRDVELEKEKPVKVREYLIATYNYPNQITD